MTYWTEAQKACFVASSLLAGAGFFVVLLEVGIPGEGDPVAWWFLAPFALPVAVAAALAFRSRRSARAILLGGLVGAGAVLIVMFALAAMTMTS